jgi:hypothetical protein
MSNASSNWIIIVCVVIFAVVGIIGPLAGYSATELKISGTDNSTYVPSYSTAWGGLAGIFSLDMWVDTVSSLSNNIMGWIDDIPVVGSMAHSLDFLLSLLLFQVEGCPAALSLFFGVLLIILTVASARVIAGLITGGGG